MGDMLEEIIEKEKSWELETYHIEWLINEVKRLRKVEEYHEKVMDVLSDMPCDINDCIDE
ncbi:hypothetical protein Kirov_146 [Bacillus phage Kirov]|uniref:Uncharacterized protein n=1 Tax=Bacillus phage Kirov TaxID=2783539 RepID=A0A7U3NKL0_9CAUD|nr:hypothetical protein PQE67_gp158 [Bacillus phage Kirov]QOV08345.1 hypothetical protein Kirov_146 [Bacillus phage Kirov]